MELGANLEKIIASGDQQLIVDALVIAHAIKADVGLVFQQYQHKIADKLPSNDEIFASNGQSIEKRMSNDRKGWQHEDLIREVHKRLTDSAVDMDTGEVVMSAREIALKILDFVQPSYWRIKELNKLGINADDYCEVGESKASISIRKVETK
jgi:hypothetical protein